MLRTLVFSGATYPANGSVIHLFKDPLHSYTPLCHSLFSHHPSLSFSLFSISALPSPPHSSHSLFLSPPTLFSFWCPPRSHRCPSRVFRKDQCVVTGGLVATAAALCEHPLWLPALRRGWAHGGHLAAVRHLLRWTGQAQGAGLPGPVHRLPGPQLLQGLQLHQVGELIEVCMNITFRMWKKPKLVQSDLVGLNRLNGGRP